MIENVKSFEGIRSLWVWEWANGLVFADAKIKYRFELELKFDTINAFNAI